MRPRLLFLVPGLLAGVLLTGAPAQAQFTVSGVTPAPNLRNAPRTSSLVVTANQPFSAGSTTALRVFSQQRGRISGAATSSGNQLQFVPGAGWLPGETVLATLTTAAQSSGGTPLARPYGWQFTAAATGGNASFGPGLTTSGVGPIGVNVLATGDIDGDGDLDAVTSHVMATGIAIRSNNGNGSFSGSTFNFSNRSQHVALADINGDGWLDLLILELATGGVSMYAVLNNGSGAFIQSTTGLTVASSLSYLTAVGDVDGDGDLDVLTPSNTNELRVFSNNGAGFFLPGPTVAVPLATSSARAILGDLDGDGDMDLVMPGATYLNNGAGQFVSGPAAPAFTNSISLGDFDGDGDLDVLQGEISSPALTMYPNAGLTTLARRRGQAGIRAELYPNPAHHTATLRLPPLAAASASCTLLSGLGQAVRTRTLPLTPGGTTATLDLAGLPAGLYTARLVAGTQSWTQPLAVE